MTLLAPLGLLGLGLLPLVVLWHLQRPQQGVLEVPSILLWQESLSLAAPRRSYRLPAQRVLLLLELSLLLIGAIALAQPARIATGSPYQIIVAIDTSLPMSATDASSSGHGRSRFSRAVRAAHGLIESLRPSGTMTLISLGTDPRILRTSRDKRDLLQTLASLRQGSGPPSLLTGEPLLTGLARLQGSSTSAILFASAGEAGLSDLRRLMPALQIRTFGLAEADRGIAHVSLRCSAARCTAEILLFNTGGTWMRTLLHADASGHTAIQNVVLPARSTIAIRLLLAGNVQTLHLHLDGEDSLPGDDNAQVAPPPSTGRSILLVTRDSTSPILQALRAIPHLAVTVTSDGSSAYRRARDEDLTIIDGVPLRPPPAGNLLLVDPSPNNGLFPITGEVTGPVISRTWRESLLLPNVDVSSLVIGAASRVSTPEWAHADWSEGETPLLFSGVEDGRRVAALLFDPRPNASPHRSNLSTLAAFPILMYNLVHTLAPLAATDSMAANDTAANGATRPSLPGANPPPVLSPNIPVQQELWTFPVLLCLLLVGVEWWYYARRT